MLRIRAASGRQQVSLLQLRKMIGFQLGMLIGVLPRGAASLRPLISLQKLRKGGPLVACNPSVPLLPL